ncbi:MAG: cupin domain-containing protein [Proteobacteria bacterium]|nr:cupin domain-containing protein [Pseudomonadota bacterium]
MSETTILKLDEQSTHDRGNGIKTTLLVNAKACGAKITTGMTEFPAHMEVPQHSHNCDEMVTIIEGDADAEIDGVKTRLKALDTTYIEAGVPHRFLNVGQGPLKILFVYDTDTVTRTFTATGETVTHLSPGDKT